MRIGDSGFKAVATGCSWWGASSLKKQNLRPPAPAKEGENGPIRAKTCALREAKGGAVQRSTDRRKKKNGRMRFECTTDKAADVLGKRHVQ